MNFDSPNSAPTVGNYAEIGLADSYPLAEGATVDENLAWTDHTPGGGFLKSAGSFGNEYTSGEVFYLGFRFREDGAGAGDYNYGYAQILGEYPVNGNETTLTIEGFAWEDTVNEPISVSAVPEPSQFVFALGLVAMSWVIGLRRIGLNRRRA
mgnify:CR=1 FL=1